MTTFSSLVVVLLLCVASSNAIKVVDVETICKKVANPSFCATLLNSKPGASKDLVSLAEYANNVVRENATNTINLIKTLIARSGSDAAAKYYYERCLYHFGDDGGVLGETYLVQQSLKVRDYLAAYDSADTIGIDVSDCLTGDYPSSPVYHDTSSLPKYADVVVLVGETIASILSFLIQT